MNQATPRRKSIFGGLLWILLGGLLLANNLGARFGFWEVLGRWWPLVIILLGCAKLFEHYASVRSGAAPARLLSGGEIFLLIILFLAAGAYTGVNDFTSRHDVDWDFPWWESYSYSEEVKQAAKPNSLIAIHVDRGKITVHPEDTPEIRVVVNKSVRALDEAEGKDLVRDYSVVVEQTANGFEIRPKLGPKFKRRIWVDLEVHLPRQSQLQIKTERGGAVVNGLTGNLLANVRGGDLEIRDITGNVDAETRSSSSDIRITNIKGDVKINGRSGGVEIDDVTGQALVQGEFGSGIRFINIGKETRFVSKRTEMTLSAVKGRAELSSGEMEIVDVPGNATVNTNNYDIRIENASGRIRVDNRNGRVEVRLPTAPKDEIEINNEKGDVDLTLPPGSEFSVDASSRNGRAESDFKGGLRVSEDEREGRIEGKVGTRGPMIKLRSTHGTLKLREGQRVVQEKNDEKAKAKG
jgi:DUF4097 and DUF4098 domain-containing protein YvlB